MPGTVVGATGGQRLGAGDAPRPRRQGASTRRARRASSSLGGQGGLVAPPRRRPRARRGGGARYYRLDGAGPGLHAGQQLRVQLAQSGGRRQKTVPYSAVIYWIDGGTWVYTRTGPLDVRAHPDRDRRGRRRRRRALRAGRPAGTQVVSVGGQELLGTEFQIEGE